MKTALLATEKKSIRSAIRSWLRYGVIPCMAQCRTIDGIRHIVEVDYGARAGLHTLYIGEYDTRAEQHTAADTANDFITAEIIRQKKGSN